MVPREPISGERWIELESKSKLDVKHSAGGREYSILGPALVLPCRDGREQIVLARGELITSVGAGARPGAMVLIATPFGVVRYGEATLTVKAETRHARVRVESGAAWLSAASGSTRSGQERLIGPEAKSRLQLSGTKLDPGKLVGVCEEEASTAKNQAEELIAKSKAPGLGERAKAHVQQRSTAREACLVAEAAARLAQEPAQMEALQKRVRKANRAWSQLPGADRDQQK